MKLKRFKVPSYWKIEKKSVKWAVSPRPGPHKKYECIPLQVIVRDILKFAETGKEAKTIINKGEILVDGAVKKDYAFPIGLMDSVSIPKIKKFYRMF
ncbi:MAG TPA: S4 domain-containing protein, partial [archaeon]|nr:S4 domain-containing protein [archaeon]